MSWRLPRIRGAIQHGLVDIGSTEAPSKHSALAENYKAWRRLYRREHAERREREPLPVFAVHMYFQSPESDKRPRGSPGPFPFDRHGVQFRNLSMCTLGIRAMMRPSELVNLKWKHVQFTDSPEVVPETGLGMPWLKIHLLEGMEGVKCNPRTIIIEPVEDALCPVTFLMCLLTAALAMHKDTPWQQMVAKNITIDQSPVFRNTKNDNHLAAAQSVSWVVRTVASNAGLTANYSGHSLRIGGACAAAIAGLGLEAIRAICGLTSDSEFICSFLCTCINGCIDKDGIQI